MPNIYRKSFRSNATQTMPAMLPFNDMLWHAFPNMDLAGMNFLKAFKPSLTKGWPKLSIGANPEKETSEAQTVCLSKCSAIDHFTLPFCVDYIELVDRVTITSVGNAKRTRLYLKGRCVRIYMEATPGGPFKSQ